MAEEKRGIKKRMHASGKKIHLCKDNNYPNWNFLKDKNSCKKMCKDLNQRFFYLIFFILLITGCVKESEEQLILPQEINESQKELIPIAEKEIIGQVAPEPEINEPITEEKGDEGFNPSAYGNPHPKIKQQIPACCNHPYWHKVYRAFSDDGLNWAKENILLKEHASVPAILQKDDGTFVLYYVNGEIDTFDCSTSLDGKNFKDGNCLIYGFTEQKAWDPYVVKLDNGFYRLYFFAPGFGNSEFSKEHKIMSAISKDGINWLQEEGIRFKHEGVLDPAVIKVGDEWEMYTGNMNTGSIVKAKSKDGLNFVKETEFNVGGNVPEIIKLDSGNYALYFCRDGISVATSTDRTYWSGSKPAIQPSQGSKEAICDPTIIKANGGWIMYYKIQEGRGMSPQPL